MLPVPLSLCPGPHPAVLPATSAVVGPCSPAAAIWLALGFLETAALPEFGTDEATAPANQRVLVITGPRHRLQPQIDEEDEPALRAAIPALERVDMRYCPTWKHAQLLLSLLAADPNPASAHLAERPALLVLTDLSALFLADVDESKENVPPPPPPDTSATDPPERQESGKERAMSRDAWAYLSLVSAGKQAAAALGAALVVLEHEAADFPLAGAGARTVAMTAGLRKILGHVVTVSASEEEQGAYEVQQGDDRWKMRKTRAEKDEYALPPTRTGDEDTGWAWSWDL